MNKDIIAQEVANALAEDIGSGDVSAALLPVNCIASAEIISREPMLVCGQAWVDEAFYQVDKALTTQWTVHEAQWLAAPQVICKIQGPARALLTAERTALNFLQTLSATATQTHYYVEQLAGTTTRLLDTRKTIPGLRLAQKYAVRCGGGVNHRTGLYDAFLIKENHIKACGSITQAITLARQGSTSLLVEVEVETLQELQEALQAGPDRILLDNFSLPLLVEAVKLNKPKRCELEASGGVTLKGIKYIAQTGVDFISVGDLTKSIKAIDLSLLIRTLL